MNKAHCWTSLSRLAAAASLVAAAAGAASAQSDASSVVTVAVRGGYASFDRAASLDKAPMLSLDAFYGVNKWLSIGPAFSLGRPQTTGKDFISQITYGVLNLGDTTSFYKATQPITVLDGALNAKVQLPGKQLSPYASGGVGGYVLFLDVQTNGGERHRVGASFNVGAGALYVLSGRAGLTLDVRAITFTDYNRSALDPRIRCDVTVPPGAGGSGSQVGNCPRVEGGLFAENFAAAPKNKSTVTNYVVSFGFSYVPSFFGGGGR